MKDMTSVASTMMSEEEKAEIEKSLNPDAPTPSVTTGPHAHSHSQSHPTTAGSTMDPASPSVPVNGHAAPASSTTSHDAAHPAAGSSSLVMHGEKDKDTRSNTTSPPPSSTKEKEKEREREAARKRNKITAEQKEKLREQEKARRKVMEERVRALTEAMVERLRPFVEAKHPGDKDDPETVAFEAKMRREAEDLKLESFGVEVRSILSGFVGVELTCVATAPFCDSFSTQSGMCI